MRKGNGDSKITNSDLSATERTMITNLPLLFSNGKPTSLEKITMSEILHFIPFMVKCSLCRGKAEDDDLKNCCIPQWWPAEKFPFRFPLRGPCFKLEKLQDLKRLVYRCYMYHKCEFLLRFSNQLSIMPPSSIKYVQNDDKETTCIYHRNGTLLVKLRNENLLYDAGKQPRKHLYPIIHPSSQVDTKKTVCIDLTELTDESSDDEKINDDKRISKEYYDTERANIRPGSRKRKRALKEIEFDVETDLPEALNQVGFLKLFELENSESGKKNQFRPSSYKIKKTCGSKKFVLLPVSSQRGQAIIKEARYTLNTEYYLDRIERYSLTTDMTSQICTRTTGSANIDDWVPDTNNEETGASYAHQYKWPKRSHNPQRMHKGPSLKKCFVKLQHLSDEQILSLLRPNKRSKATMTPVKWHDETVMCICSFMSETIIDNKNNSKSCSTRCNCTASTENSSHISDFQNSSISKNNITDGQVRIRTRSTELESPLHSNFQYPSRTHFFHMKCDVPQIKGIRTLNTNSPVPHTPLKNLKVPKSTNIVMTSVATNGVFSIKSRNNSLMDQQSIKNDDCIATRRSRNIISKPDLKFSQPLQENLIPTSKVAMIKRRRNYYPKVM